MQAKNNNKQETIKSVIQVVVFAAIFIAIYYLLFSFVFSNDRVSGTSMQPNFEDNDRVIALRHTKIRRDDIVVLRAPHTKNDFYIKRVIGMPGDTVSFKNDTLYINHHPKKEPYLDQGKKLYAGSNLYTYNFSLGKLAATQGINKVPKNSYFVMGDHRNISKDSRLIGYINKDRIIGVVKFRYWPLNKIQTY